MTRRVKSLFASAFVALVMVSVVSAAVDPLDPKVKINNVDQAHATAAVLVKTDLGPAWAGGVRKPNALKLPICPAYHPDDSDLTITGHAESLYTLASSGIQIDSDVVVLKTAKQVDIQFSRILQPKLSTCLRYDLLKSYELQKSTVGKGMSVIIGKVSRLKLTKLGTHSGLFRVSVLVTLDKKTYEVFTDFMFLAQNRTQFYVQVTAPSSVESQLPSLETRIARALVKRAEV